MKAIVKTIALVTGIFLMSGGQPAKAVYSPNPYPEDLPTVFLDLKISDFVKLSAKDFSTIAGKKMNLKEKVSFSMMKMDMKKTLKKQGDQTVGNYLLTAKKGKNTAMWIILGAVVVVVIIVIIVNSMDFGIGWGE